MFKIGLDFMSSIVFKFLALLVLYRKSLHSRIKMELTREMILVLVSSYYLSCIEWFICDHSES